MALLRKDLTLQKAAAEEGLKAKAGTLDRMLLCLFDALFLTQCETWTESGVSNLPADETPELAKYFIRGLKVGEKPIFDAMRFSCQPSQATRFFLTPPNNTHLCQVLDVWDPALWGPDAQHLRMQ